MMRSIPSEHYDSMMRNIFATLDKDDDKHITKIAENINTKAMKRNV